MKKWGTEFMNKDIAEVLITEEQIKAGEKMPDYHDESARSACKSFKADESVRTVQMGRVLTLTHGTGLGRELLEEGIRTAWDIIGADRIFIEAEDYVEGYYTKAGFVRTSDVFLKDDIPHVHMELWK